MVELGAERARELGLANATFVEADAERLELEPASFDAALSRWGLMLMPEPRAALARIHAALRPGARIACSVWSEPARVPFLTLGREAVAQVLGVAPPPEGAPGPFRLAADGALYETLEGAGFELEPDAGPEGCEEPFPVRFVFASPDAYADFVLELSGQLSAALAEADEPTRSAAREALLAEARPLAAADGSLALTSEARVAVARRP